MQGVLWAGIAGVSFGLFQAVNRRASRDLDGYVATFALLLVSVVALASISTLTQDLRTLAAAPASSLLWFALAGFFHFCLGWTFLGLSQRRIGAARTGVLVGTTPLFGTIVAFVALGETVRPLALAGVLVVVAGIAVLSGVRLGERPAGTARFGLGLSYGFATAVCWGMSPVFIRWGLEGVASPLLGVTVGMAASAVCYGLALLVRPIQHRARGVGVRDGALLVLAGMLVTAGIAGQWIALELIHVAAVLTLNQLSVPVVLLVAPLIVGGKTEVLTAKTISGAVIVLTGTLLIILSRTG